MMDYLLYLVIPAIVTAVIAALIAARKGRSVPQFLIIGLILGPIGILWAALAEGESDSPSRRVRGSRRGKSRNLDPD